MGASVEEVLKPYSRDCRVDVLGRMPLSWGGETGLEEKGWGVYVCPWVGGTDDGVEGLIRGVPDTKRPGHGQWHAMGRLTSVSSPNWSIRTPDWVPPMADSQGFVRGWGGGGGRTRARLSTRWLIHNTKKGGVMFVGGGNTGRWGW